MRFVFFTFPSTIPGDDGILSLGFEDSRRDFYTVKHYGVDMRWAVGYWITEYILSMR